MKSYLSLILFSLVSMNSFSQEAVDSTSIKKTKINRWSVDFAFGSSRGIRPYNDGYFSTENDTFLGELNLNSINLGARYYINKYVTFKSDLAFDRFTPQNNKSLDFDVAQFRFSIQTMFNLNTVFGINDISKFKLLTHIGLNISSLKTIKSSNNQTIGSPDDIVGVIYGFSPMYNISKKASLFLDLSLINNFRQHHTWDGNVSDEKNNLTGQMSNISLGISYKLGEPINVAKEEIKNLEEIEALDKRIGDLETMMNDTDTDGVPDYLDVENNSIAGVAVDTKGRMVDRNKNGMPDELEKYMADTYMDKSHVSQTITTANTDMIKKLINQGYVSTYFGTNKTKPTNVSTEGIDFMLTYLRTNPSSSIEIVGHADEIGKSTYNDKLCNERANNVRNMLIKAGVNTSRLTVVSQGEDASVAPDSAEARRLVRKVTFRVK